MPKCFLSTLMFENHHCKHPIRACSKHLPRAARASVSSKQWQSSRKFPASLLLLPTSPMSPNAKACPMNSLAYLCLPYRPVLSSLQTCLAYSCFPASVVAKSPIFLMAFSQHSTWMSSPRRCLLNNSLPHFPEFTFLIQFTDTEDILFICILSVQEQGQPLTTASLPFYSLSPFYSYVPWCWTLTNQQMAKFIKTGFKRNVLTVFWVILQQWPWTRGPRTKTTSSHSNNKSYSNWRWKVIPESDHKNRYPVLFSSRKIPTLLQLGELPGLQVLPEHISWIKPLTSLWVA